MPTKSETARGRARDSKSAAKPASRPAKSPKATAKPGVAKASTLGSCASHVPAALPADGLVDQSYELVAVGQLSQHPKNANAGDVVAIDESVDANGFYGACIVQRSTGRILVGNHRWQVARARGLATIPVIFVDVDDAHALRILLADNATRRKAKTHEDVVLEILASLKSPVGTGYTVADAAEMASRARPKLGYLDQVGGRPGRDDDEEDLVSGATEFPRSKEDRDDDGDAPEREGRKDRFPLAIVLSSAEKRAWDTFKKRVDLTKDKAAFLALLETAKN